MRVGDVIGKMFSPEFRIINLAESYISPGFGHIGSVLIFGRSSSQDNTKTFTLDPSVRYWMIIYLEK